MRGELTRPGTSKIGIAGRQCPNGMEMVRQDADGVCFERQVRCNRTINLPQAIDMLDKQPAGPVSKRNRENKVNLSVPELNGFPKHHARFIEASIIRDYGNTRWIRFAQQFHSKAFVKSNRVQI